MTTFFRPAGSPATTGPVNPSSRHAAAASNASLADTTTVASSSTGSITSRSARLSGLDDHNTMTTPHPAQVPLPDSSQASDGGSTSTALSSRSSLRDVGHRPRGQGPGRGGRAPITASRSSGRSASSRRRQRNRTRRSGRSRSQSTHEADPPPVDVPMPDVEVVAISPAPALGLNATANTDAAPPTARAAVAVPSPAQTSIESPQRQFQSTLQSELTDLQRQQGTPSRTTTTPTPIRQHPSPTSARTSNRGHSPSTSTIQEADDETVARDNATGPFVHIFVNQPVETPQGPTPGQFGIATTPSISGRFSHPSGRSASGSTRQDANRPIRLAPAQHVTARYEIRVNVPPSSAPDDELRTALVNFFTKLQEADPSLVLYPWAERDNRDDQNGSRPFRSISAPTGIPVDLAAIKRYFPRVIPKATGGFVYPSVWCGHTKPFREIVSHLQGWFQGERHGFWNRQLQCESTLIVGWGLYSTQTIHAPTLRAALSAELGYEVGIRWRTISTGQSGTIPANQLAKALHFEVDRRHKSDAKRRLAAIYDRQAEDFPLGIKMRLVWRLHDLMNVHTRAKVAALRLRQLQFCQAMVSMRTWEIHDIDLVDDDSGLSLRNRLMELKSQSGHRLFHTVDPSHIEGAVQFCFHPDREDEARTMILALVPYLRWKVSQVDPPLPDREREILLSRTVYRHFSQDALERAIGATWNPVTMTVDSPADSYSAWVHDMGDAELDCSKFGDGSGTVAITPSPHSIVRTTRRLTRIASRPSPRVHRSHPRSPADRYGRTVPPWRPAPQPTPSVPLRHLIPVR